MRPSQAGSPQRTTRTAPCRDQFRITTSSAPWSAAIWRAGASWRLEIHGLVDHPVRLSLADLQAMPEHEQITQHFCIQGWSGVARWGGVSMAAILDLVRPRPEARWVVFYSLGDGADGGLYAFAIPSR